MQRDMKQKLQGNMALMQRGFEPKLPDFMGPMQKELTA
jgi:hypothetical protein